jgi:hypothetical protein
VVPERLRGHPIQRSRRHIRLELPIPGLVIKSREPPSERGELVGGQPLDPIFESLHLLIPCPLSRTSFVCSLPKGLRGVNEKASIGEPLVGYLRHPGTAG